jgi:hypothetical protein
VIVTYFPSINEYAIHRVRQMLFGYQKPNSRQGYEGGMPLILLIQYIFPIFNLGHLRCEAASARRFDPPVKPVPNPHN